MQWCCDFTVSNHQYHAIEDEEKSTEATKALFGICTYGSAGCLQCALITRITASFTNGLIKNSLAPFCKHSSANLWSSRPDSIPTGMCFRSYNLFILVRNSK